MFTQCPHCTTVFPIDSEGFAAGGRVLCGVCEREFDALLHLRRQAADDGAAPRLDPEFAERQGDLFAAAVSAPEPPSFARPLSLPPSDRRWWLAAAALLLLLLGQMVLAERHRWALQPAWRAAYEPLCGLLGCSLPPWHEPQAFALLAREIGPHPAAADALLLSASLRNDAAWAQPLPMLELSLSDLDGQVVGFRRFYPSEYRLQSEAELLAPGQTAALQLELVDPGKDALAFALEFR